MNHLSSRALRRNGSLARRTFLKALGLGIAAPLSLRMARLATAQEVTRPTRLFLFYLPHGMPIEHWDVGEQLDFGQSGLGIFSALGAYRDYVTVLRGVGINTATNHAAIRSVFTGDESSNSIDYEIATRLSTTAHVLGAFANPADAGSDAQLIKHGGWVDPVAHPADAVEDLFFGLGASAGESTDAVDEAQFRREGLSLTEFELEEMQKALSGLTKEQNKLSVHLESLRAYREVAQSGSGVSSSTCAERPSLPAVEAARGKDPYDMRNLGAMVDGHLEAAAQSLLCGSARVVTMQNLYANAQVMMNFEGGPGIAKNHHDPLSHSSNGQVDARMEFAQVQKWFVDRLVEKVVSVLAGPDPADPGRSALDNTTIVMMSEVVDGANHSSAYSPQTWDVPGGPRETYLPALLIGKGGGTIAGGRSVYVPGTDHRDFLATAAHAMGVSLQSFGGKNVSPIAEVLS